MLTSSNAFDHCVHVCWFFWMKKMTALGKATVVILIVLVWTGDSLASHHRSRRSNNEYILHRCTATAELIRKHRHEGAIGVSSRKTEENSPQTLRRDLASLTDVLTSKEIPSSVYRRTTHMRRRVNVHPRRIADRQTTDTPLKTVNINVPKDRPSAFRKKNPLPELAHDISGRKLDSSPNVIIIKPVT